MYSAIDLLTNVDGKTNHGDIDLHRFEDRFKQHLRHLDSKQHGIYIRNNTLIIAHISHLHTTTNMHHTKPNYVLHSLTIYIYIYIYMYIYMYIYIYVCVFFVYNVYKHIHTYTHTHIYIYIYTTNYILRVTLSSASCDVYFFPNIFCASSDREYLPPAWGFFSLF